MKEFHGTTAEFAKLHNLTERRMYSLIKSGDPRFKKLGDKWFVYETPEDDPEVGLVINFSEWRAKKMKEDALRAQREREILEGTLLSRDEVLRQLGEAFHVTKSNLLTIPNTIAGVVAMETDANVIKEIIEGAIRETLVGLRSTILRAGFDRDFDEVASEVDSSSVG
tara:strand:+ start:47 stop:547 length:501 start_codon:yes stop_codon:yes gene_type:complete